MAHLKDLFVNGPVRFLGRLTSKELQAETINSISADLIASHPADDQLHLQPGEREKWTPDTVLSVSSDRPIANKAVANAGFATVSYVQGLIGSGRLKRFFSDELPTENIDTEAVYFIKDPAGTYPSLYLEYMNYTGTDTGWEYIGNNAIRLEDYYKKAESNSLFALKADMGAKTDLATSNKNSLVDAVNEVFHSGSDIKSKVTAAVTAMGQASAVTDPWDMIVNKISAIKPVLTGSASNLQVLTGYTFYNTDSQTKLEGALPSRGFGDLTINCGDTIRLTEGYYTGHDSITANSLASQTPGTAADGYILKNYTAWVNGGKITGIMTDWRGIPNVINAMRIENGRIEVAVQSGYHGCSWLDNSYEYMSFSQAAGLIGLTAAKLVAGNTVLGIAGSVDPNAYYNNGYHAGYAAAPKGKALIYCGEIGGGSDSGSGITHSLTVKTILPNWASLTISNFLFDVEGNFRTTGGDVASHYCYITKSYSNGTVSVNLTDTGNRRDTIMMKVFAYYDN